MNMRPFFADDIFISYARKDSSTYASGLADELTKRGLSCFIDRLGTEANKELPGSLRRKVRSCALLVVVGTRWSGTRVSIKEEIEEFKNTRRPIVPVDIDGLIFEAIWYGAIEGIAPELEKNPRALDDGNPCLAVVSRIEKAFTYRRRNERLRRWTIATAAFLVLLVAVSVLAGQKAVIELAKATQAQVAAEKARGEAAAAKAEADQAKSDAVTARDQAVRAQSNAREQQRLAGAATREAQKQTQLAAAATSRAREAAANAERQQEIAVGRRTETSADSLRAQSVQEKHGWANKLQYSVLLSVEAEKRLSALGLPLAESERSLRDSLNLLPRSVRTFEHEVEDALLTPDGKYLITKEHEFMRMWENAGHTQVSKDIEIDGGATFNRDRTLMATGQDKGPVMIWELPQGNLLWKIEWADNVIFSPDGRYLAALNYRSGEAAPGKTTSIMVWPARGGQQVSEVKYQGSLTGIALSPGNDLLALSLTHYGDYPNDNIVQIWEVKNPATLVREVKTEKQFSFLTFSPDGRFLAASGGVGPSIMEVRGGKEFTPIKGEGEEYIQQVIFSPDGNTIGTRGDHGSLQTWDVLTGKQLWYENLGDFENWDGEKPYVALPDEGGARVVDVRTGKDVARVIQSEKVRGVDYAADAGQLVLFSDKHVSLYDLANAQQVPSVSGHGPSPVSGASAAGPSKLTASTTDQKYSAVIVDDTVRISETATGREIWRMENIPSTFVIQDEDDEDKKVKNVEMWFSKPTARFFVLQTRHDDAIRIFEVSSHREIARSKGGRVYFIDEERSVAMEDEDGTRIIDIPRGTLVLNLAKVKDGGKVVFSEDKRQVARALGDTIEVFGIVGARTMYKVTMANGISDYAFSPGDKYLVAVGGKEHSEGQIWEAASRSHVATLAFTTVVKSLVFSPDGRYLVPSNEAFVQTAYALSGTGYYDTRYEGVWEIGRWRRVITFREGVVNQVVFSPDGRQLVTAGSNYSARVYELDSGREIADLMHYGSFDDVSFSADGRFMVARSSEWALVWEIDSWREIARLRHEGYVISAAIAADGRQLATVSGDSTKLVWILEEDKLLQRACESLTRNLSPEEWRQNFGGERYRVTCPNLQSVAEAKKAGQR